MEKNIALIVLFCIVCLPCYACNRAAMGIGPMPENLQDVRSLGENETGCLFIQSLYAEVQNHNMRYYLAKNTVDFGGNRYKILSTNNEFVMGVNILMVNYEVYKCE